MKYIITLTAVLFLFEVVLILLSEFMIKINCMNFEINFKYKKITVLKEIVFIILPFFNFTNLFRLFFKIKKLNRVNCRFDMNIFLLNENLKEI